MGLVVGIMAEFVARLRTAETELKLVLIEYFEDQDGFFWHHRTEVVKREPGTWMAGTPTLGIQGLDLKEHRALPLTWVSSFLREVQDKRSLSTRLQQPPS